MAAIDATSSHDDEDQPMYHRLRRRITNRQAASQVREAELPLPPPPQRAAAKAGKSRVVRRRNRVPRDVTASTSSTRVDPVEDELLLDCALAMRPHAHSDASQRARIWQEIATELKQLDGTRLTQYSANGLMMRLGYLLKVFKNPLHREHNVLQGTLRAKLTQYSESMPLTQTRRRPVQVAHATTQAHEDEDDVSDSDSDSDTSTAERALASESYGTRRGQNSHAVSATSTPHPQAPHGRGLDHVVPPANTRAAESVPSASSSAMFMALMQHAERGWRQQHDESMLLLRQSGALYQRCLAQHEARMADQREWRTRCLALIVEPPRVECKTRREENEASDSDEYESTKQADNLC